MKSRINAFFIEIIIVILFFSLSIMVILQLFAAAHVRNQDSTSSSIAMVKAQDITEKIKANCKQDLDLNFLPGFVVNAQGDQSKAYIYCDKDWEYTNEEAEYKITLTISKEDAGNGVMLNSSIDVIESNGEKVICELDSQKYLSGK